MSLLHSFTLSLAIATFATIIAALICIPLAYMMLRQRPRSTAFLETLLTMPLVLPPTVVGYFLLVVFGKHGIVGQFLSLWWHYSIVFRIEGAILAATIVAIPLIYLPAKSAFAGIPREMIEAACVCGAKPRQVFWRVALPLAIRGIASGLTLAFVRALGEFGATVMIFGRQPGKMTLPITIYDHYESGEIAAALPAVLTLMGIAFVALTVQRSRVVV
jgi:molybdate transport system permease protein